MRLRMYPYFHFRIKFLLSVLACAEYASISASVDCIVSRNNENLLDNDTEATFLSGVVYCIAQESSNKRK